MFTAQVDFTHAGDLMVFVDEERIASLEKRMKEQGYLEASNMATAFNLLRSNDLIWPYVVNNYLRGKKPFPFDILYWNSDATRMPAANHSFYLRNCYLDNKLTKGEMEVGGVKLDLKKIKVPLYNLATREDHIAPAKSVSDGLSVFRRQGEICAGGFRPYCRRRQSAQPGRNISIGPATSRWRPISTMAESRDRACGLLVAGLVGVAKAARR